MTSVLLTVCVLGSGYATAAPTPAASSLSSWAYGTVKTVDFSGLGANYSYSGSATFGFSVVFNETQNASGTITVHAVRTIGAILSARFCIPTCAAHVGNVSFHAWETSDAWANLTTAGTVYESGVAVPGLGLLNSSVSVSAKLRESGELSLAGIETRARTLAVNVSGAVAVSLTAPGGLGLLPITLTPGSTWNSSSPFDAKGSAKWASYATLTDRLGTTKAPANGTISVSRTGTLAVTGSYLTGSDVTFGGSQFPAVNLTVAGPFALREGVILFPASADLFGAGAHPWGRGTSASTVVSAIRLDVHPGRYYRGHFPILASGFSATSTTADAVVAAGALGPAIAPSAVAPAGSNGTSTFVQGQPESIGGAQSQQNCLINDVGCPLAGRPLLPLRLVFVAGVGALAVAVIALTVVARRRPLRPVYPNSALYPPGGVAAEAPPSSPTPPPAEDDPLSHLW